ncbi:Uncharacterised protein [Burkholderia pseudomallei]|nr:Uncharacterised protein [Burkholderia pseudomallei]CAJ6831755.1 Uncharacterised protein [Burkholderia pseudomallei]CAJ9543496.1 Uncharacterised protein [Burkholderia pseudomallei]CAJ9941256.1 Uncharacterised protein [Burkholderia pseudomallei]CAK1283792.1 Uncharacterised protein [Burkholderia pseudomallei]
MGGQPGRRARRARKNRLSAVYRRAARVGGAVRHAVSPRCALAARRVCRRRYFLRDFRFRRERVGREPRADVARAISFVFLCAAHAADPARARRGAARDRAGLDAVHSGVLPERPKPDDRAARVLRLEQRDPRRAGRGLFFTEGRIQSVYAHVVARRRRAVLSAVSAAVPCMAGGRQAPIRVGRAVRGGAVRVARVERLGAPRDARAGVLSDLRALLGTRGGRAAVSVRRARGPPGGPAGGGFRDRSGRVGVGGCRAGRLRRVEAGALSVPGRARTRCRRARAARPAARARAGEPGARGARAAGAALRRPHFLFALPVALAGLRRIPLDARARLGGRQGERVARRVRAGDGIVPLHRDAVAARRRGGAPRASRRRARRGRGRAGGGCGALVDAGRRAAAALAQHGRGIRTASRRTPRIRDASRTSGRATFAAASYGSTRARAAAARRKAGSACS